MYRFGFATGQIQARTTQSTQRGWGRPAVQIGCPISACDMREFSGRNGDRQFCGTNGAEAVFLTRLYCTQPSSMLASFSAAELGGYEFVTKLCSIGTLEHWNIGTLFRKKTRVDGQKCRPSVTEAIRDAICAANHANMYSFFYIIITAPAQLHQDNANTSEEIQSNFWRVLYIVENLQFAGPRRRSGELVSCNVLSKPSTSFFGGKRSRVPIPIRGVFRTPSLPIDEFRELACLGILFSRTVPELKSTA